MLYVQGVVETISAPYTPLYLMLGTSFIFLRDYSSFSIYRYSTQGKINTAEILNSSKYSVSPPWDWTHSICFNYYISNDIDRKWNHCCPGDVFKILR